MALTVTLLGVSYSIPETSDVGYDTALTSYLKALATAFPQLNGGVQSLTAELDFGTSFGIKAAWYKSETVNPASAGQVRLAKTDSVKFRNNANGADLALAIDTGDALLWNGANVTGNPMLDATTAVAQSFANTTLTTVVYGTTNRDTDSAYNSGTGVFTVPTGKGGDYLVTAAIQFSTAIAAGSAPFVGVYKNGVLVNDTQLGLTVAAFTSFSLGTIFNAAAGNTIEIKARQSSGGAITLSGSATENFFKLKRIPT